MAPTGRSPDATATAPAAGATGVAVPVAFTPRARPAPPPPAPPPGAVRAVADRLRLARFVTQLVVKEHLAPNLHVRPLVAELFLTDNCNLRCVSCACWRTTTRRELTTHEWCDVVDQLAHEGFLKINLTGGEPLLRADTPAIAAHARRAGIRHVHLNTNAVLLDDRRRDAVLDAGVRSFNVSLDGPDAATHDAVRGVPGSFDRSLAHLGGLLHRRAALKLRVRVNLTVLRDNLAALPAMVRLVRELGVPLSLNLASDTTFLFRHPEVSEHATQDGTTLDAVLREIEPHVRADRRVVPAPAVWRELRRHLAEGPARTPPCAESQLKLLVRSTGDVGGCWGHDGGVNVREHRVADVLAGDAYRAAHARYHRRQCVGCTSGYALNLALRPSTYGRDLRWRLGIGRLA